MTPVVWSKAALGYFTAHAIDAQVALDLGLTEDRSAVVFPTLDADGSPAPRRRLLGSNRAKMLGPKGVRLAVWWPIGRPKGQRRILVCEGEADAVGVLSVLRCSHKEDAAASYARNRLDGVCAVPGTPYPASRLVADLRAAGASEAVLAFDADDAGLRYREQVIEALNGTGIAVTVVSLPDGEDLASVLAAAGDRIGLLADLLPPKDRPPSEADLLDLTAEMIERYVVLPGQHERTALALFVAHSHALGGAHATPYILVISPEKRSGKSRLLQVLELMVARPWNVVGTSEAAMFRKIAKDSPTLLLDEIDAIFGAHAERTEPLRAILNAGNRPGATVARCVGENRDVEDFPIYCAKVLAGIDSGHRIPDTIRDRAVAIHMKRKTGAETVARFRYRDAEAETAPIREELAKWGGATCEPLLDADPDLPDQLDDRAAEAWEPLFAIADRAGGGWPAKARAAAVVLSGEGDRDEVGTGTLLLRGIRNAFGNHDRLSTVDLLAGINSDDELPFGGWREEKGLDSRGLARYLRPYGVKSRSIRFSDGGVAKGYLKQQFEEAWERWLTPDRTVTSDTSVTPTPDQATGEPLYKADVTDVTHVTPLAGRNQTTIDNGAAGCASHSGAPVDGCRYCRQSAEGARR